MPKRAHQHDQPAIAPAQRARKYADSYHDARRQHPPRALDVGIVAIENDTLSAPVAITRPLGMLPRIAPAASGSTTPSALRKPSQGVTLCGSNRVMLSQKPAIRNLYDHIKFRVCRAEISAASRSSNPRRARRIRRASSMSRSSAATR